MATQTITKPLFGATGQSEGHNLPYFTSIVIDFGATTHTSTDVFATISVPVDTMVLAAGIDVLTVDAAGNSGQIDLVDSVNSVTYVASAIPTTLGAMTSSDATAEMFVTYSTLDTLDVTVSVGILDGKVRVWALMCDLTDPITAQRVTFA